MARICCQTFDILHVSVEPNQFAPNRILRPDATDDNPIRSKHFQQSCECRPVLMDETPCRIGAAAAGQMLRNKADDSRLVDRVQCVPLARQPVGKMCDTAQINAPGRRCIPPTVQVRAESQHIGLQDAALQPCARLGLHDDLFGHDDLLFG